MNRLKWYQMNFYYKVIYMFNGISYFATKKQRLKMVVTNEIIRHITVIS